jgi:outer membrane protein TolC
MKTKILVTTLAVAVGLVAWPIAVGETPEAEQAPELDQLLNQRQATLRQLVEVVTEEYRQGIRDFDPVVRATDRLIAADLELAKTSKDRIALLQRRVEVMKGFSAMADMKFMTGQASQSELLSARAALLDSQIQLAREQTGGDGEPK